MSFSEACCDFPPPSQPEEIYVPESSPLRDRPISPAPETPTTEPAQELIMHSAHRLLSIGRQRLEETPQQAHSLVLSPRHTMTPRGSTTLSGQAVPMESPTFRDSPKPGTMMMEMNPLEQYAVTVQRPRGFTILNGEEVPVQSPTFREAPKPGTLQMELTRMEQQVHSTQSSPLKSSSSHTARCTAAISDQALLMVSPNEPAGREVHTTLSSPLKSSSSHTARFTAAVSDQALLMVNLNEPAGREVETMSRAPMWCRSSACATASLQMSGHAQLSGVSNDMDATEVTQPLEA
eukprot:GGOE01020167.1.p1 GENE.GGOE01020167.1~~GGOE01020167.1.p1  ORF type:complete len:292 (-),score=62.34 GGOE01020167.1:380-1255(-)